MIEPSRISEEEKYQDKIANDYSRAYEHLWVKKTWDYPILKKYLKYFDRNYPLLDLACGTGASTAYYSKHGFPVIAYDLSEKMLEQVKKRNLLNKPTCIKGIAEKLPFKKEEIGQIFCSGSFHHFEDQLKSLAEMHRVLKPSGKVMILENNNESLHRYFIPRFIRDKMQPQFKKKYGESVHEEECREEELTIKDYRKIISQTNFKIKSIKTYYFARIVSLVEKPKYIRNSILFMLGIMDAFVKLFKDRGYWVVILLEKE
ncbi:MAG: class I SAM-dependent methyltransferase [Nanoarchaeota archaeon]|nr:class I SAM-dependent methyltransferase [Nanoarchaeota archaeon]MBU1622600.1 class I SAM-dependent methyltransferase [Nanoarchaeota archaeon]MBU1974694.1 class I SAM-dependent methyltransferase [Nanoarchaeota archaeon]